MNSCAELEKKRLRQDKISARKALSAEVRRTANAAITSHLRSLLSISFRLCGRTEPYSALIGYVSDGTEPELKDVMQEWLDRGGILCLPRVAGAGSYDIVRVSSLSFSRSAWGIPEPGPEAECVSADLLKNACWLVPGVAFDSSGMRLGRGKGVYDRLLANGAAYTIGVFYECQKCDRVPAEPHDQALDAIVTETGPKTIPAVPENKE